MSPKPKKVKEAAKPKPEEEKKEEPKTKEEVPPENGEAKTEEVTCLNYGVHHCMCALQKTHFVFFIGQPAAAADEADKKDGEAEKEGKTE